MSYSSNDGYLGFNADETYSLIEWDEPSASGFIGILRSSDQAVARFGHSPDSPTVLETGFADWRTGDQSLFWTTTDDRFYPSDTSNVIRVLHAPEGTADVAPTEDERIAQARAVATMRRREAEVTAENERLRIELEAARRALHTAQEPISDVNDERLYPIWEQASDAADNAGFCREYERMCDELGLPPEARRQRQHRGEVTLTVTLYTYANGRDEDDAEYVMREVIDERLSSLDTVIAQDFERAGVLVSSVDTQRQSVSEVQVWS